MLTTPVVRNLKQQLSGAEVHYCTKSQFGILFENNPYIDKVFYLDKSLNNLISELKKEDYDYVIDLHNNLRTSIIKWRLGKKSFTFDKLNLKKWLLVNLKLNTLPSLHIVDRYMATVKKLGITDDTKGLDYFIPSKDKVNPQNFGLEPDKYIAFAIGAQHATKRLPLQKLIEACSLQDMPIVLLGGKEDKVSGDSVVEACKGLPFPVINLSGQLSLNQSASFLEQSKFVISHDTGLMHIASAFKKEIYSIWGNTVPEFGMFPYLTKYHILEKNKLSCRPCSKIGYKQCPKGHFKCMNELDLKQEFDIIKKQENPVSRAFPN
ncbi:glycosyl transferase [Sporocytophaga myxococcoides]|uniref:Glycosyl transferase n=1 Tax=Sporocytophaga myxococcoides TaxID=153721 RepID=A0A098LCQ6_9BACT|nr:glycosyl transferase [Sporocytophaga myxococcoides]